MWSVELRTAPEDIRGQRVQVSDEQELESLLRAKKDDYEVAIVQDGSLVIGVYRQHASGCWRNALAH